MEEVCKNCGALSVGQYCSNCGQKFNMPSFTFKHITEEAFHAFTHADKSFVAFIKQLLINPGRVAREYIIEGKRKKYFNPFTFFLLITAINAFAEGSELKLKEKLFHFNNEYGHLFNVYSKLLSIIILPVFALAMWLIHYKRQEFRYSEYVVFAMILLSLTNLVDVVFHTLNYGFTTLLHSSVQLGDNLVYLVLVVMYFAYADYTFHLKTHKSSLLQSALTGLLFFAVLCAIQLFIIYGYINDFKGIGSFTIYGVKIH